MPTQIIHDQAVLYRGEGVPTLPGLTGGGADPYRGEGTSAHDELSGSCADDAGRSPSGDKRSDFGPSSASQSKGARGGVSLLTLIRGRRSSSLENSTGGTSGSSSGFCCSR